MLACVVTGALADPSVAQAQLVVGKSDPKPTEQRVIVLREGDRSIVTLSARVDAKAERVAWLYPIDAVGDGGVDALAPTPVDPKIVRAVADVSGPKIQEYWELDPCELHTAIGPGPGPSSGSDAAPKPKDDASASKAPGFDVSLVHGKLDDAKDALKKKGLELPKSAEAALSAYLDAGKTIVVADVATKDLDGGRLPPLRIETTSTAFTLPTRLAATREGAALEIFVIAPGVRFEAESEPNVAAFTNLDVGVAAKGGLPSLFERLRARSLADQPGALLTEYAWRASGCDQCASPLDQATFDALGLRVLPSAKEGKQGEVLVHADAVSNTPGGPDALRSALGACYEKALGSAPDLAATVTFDVVVTNDAVESVKARDESAPAFADCAHAAIQAADLDRSGPLSVDLVPMSRKYFADLVLTRLYAKWASAPEKDLVLRPARAIEGGREEGLDGKPVKKVYWAETGSDSDRKPGVNNFQARYVVRHPWKGKIECHAPRRGFWGGPPAGEKPSKVASKKIDKIEDVVEGDLPPPSDLAIAYEPPPPPPAPPAPDAAPDSPPSALPMPSTSASAVPAAPVADEGCGCGVAPRPFDSRAAALVAALIVVLGRRARARDRRARGEAQ
ncbi:MAG TPA: DUF2330 domain-containing protein [Polyangiaceae bacterium]|nr:DUF2330 domain-containing protein [Polyangiaceae bacterium]